MWKRFAIAALGVASLGARADTPQNITPGEVALLPPYCADSQTFDNRGTKWGPTPAQAVWVGKMGQTFWAVHHYCWAMVSAARAMRAEVKSQQRQGLLQAALNDCQFVIDNATPDFPLLPEIYLRMGQYSVGLRNLPRAMEFFEKSRATKEDYWPAYLELSSVYLQIGKREQAVDVLNAGLQKVPDQPGLVEALRKLKASPVRPAHSAAPGSAPR